MHITTFLNKFSQNSLLSNDNITQQYANIFQLPKRKLAHSLSNKVQTINQLQHPHQLITIKNHKNQTKLQMQHLDRHRPTVKDRLFKNKIQNFKDNSEINTFNSIKNNQELTEDNLHEQIHVENYEDATIRNKYRKKLQDKFKSIINSKHELLLSIQNKQLPLKNLQKIHKTSLCHKNKSKSSKSSLYFEKKVQESIIREIPDYAKNIMKPCKIGSMSILTRPLTSCKPSERALISAHQYKYNSQKKEPSGLYFKQIGRETTTDQKKSKRYEHMTLNPEPWGSSKQLKVHSHEEEEFFATKFI